jgi:hypothetical protein
MQWYHFILIAIVVILGIALPGTSIDEIRSFGDSIYCQIGGDCVLNTSGFYVYNDTSTIYFNETLMNDTIDARAGSGGGVNCNVTGTCPVIAYMNYTNNGFIQSDKFMLGGGNEVSLNRTTTNDLIIRNNNPTGSVILRFNDSGIMNNFVTFNATLGQMKISNNYNKVIGTGILQVTGTYNTGIAAAMMTFDPTLNGGSFYGFFINPLFNSSGSFTAISLQARSNDFTNDIRMFDFTASGSPLYSPNKNKKYTRYTETLPLQFIFVPDSSNITKIGFEVGSLVTLGDAGTVNINLSDNPFKIKGGVNRIFGTNGQVRTTGIIFEGFQNRGIEGKDEIVALRSSGGTFEFLNNSFVNISTLQAGNVTVASLNITSLVATGGNAGTSVCIDANNQLCPCGSCA